MPRPQRWAAAHFPSLLPKYRYKTARDKHQTGPTTVVLEQGVWDGEAKKKEKKGNLLNTAHVWQDRWQSHNTSILASQWQEGISWFSLGDE